MVGTRAFLGGKPVGGTGTRSKQQSARPSNLRRSAAHAAAAVVAPLALIALGLGTAAPGSGASPSLQHEYEQRLQPLVAKYCISCHGVDQPRGGVSLAGFEQIADVQREQHTWRQAAAHLRDRTMPPRGTPQPDPEERDAAAEWLIQALDAVDESVLPKDPGRALIHRLGRVEYNNTVRDLFGVDIRPADSFPADGGGGAGFDNNAATLFIPPILMERYLEAAGEVLAAAPAERLFIARPGGRLSQRGAAARILNHFGPRAFRRPFQKGEADRFLRLYDQSVEQGTGFEEGVRFALKALLVSPHFLFRVERDAGGGEAHRINDYELATRLSYFLWSSLPDEELFRLAGRNRLRHPRVLNQQVRRMLRDPKAAAFAESFAGQWLRVRELDLVQPDARKFAAFTPELREAMYREPIEFFHALLRENQSLLRLLDSDHTFVNETLAAHYGVEGVRGPEFRRVSLPDNTRGGVLTMAGVLTVTSYPHRTSPVLRGKWVLEEVLGADVPPPPPSAPGLAGDETPREGLSFRQRLEKHRDKPECASCHARMDPIGFGLENFDGLGRWRDEIAGEKIDAAGVLTTGERFDGPVELKRLLLARREDFIRNLAEKMLSYSLGRGLEPYDIPTVRRVRRALEQDDYRAETLIREIVNSYPFQHRKSQ
jgi:mono/diheme cytochrome c family protein